MRFGRESLLALWSNAHANITAIRNGREKERIIFNNKRRGRMVCVCVCCMFVIMWDKSLPASVRHFNNNTKKKVVTASPKHPSSEHVCVCAFAHVYLYQTVTGSDRQRQIWLGKICIVYI